MLVFLAMLTTANVVLHRDCALKGSPIQPLTYLPHVHTGLGFGTVLVASQLEKSPGSGAEIVCCKHLQSSLL